MCSETTREGNSRISLPNKVRERARLPGFLQHRQTNRVQNTTRDSLVPGVEPEVLVSTSFAQFSDHIAGHRLESGCNFHSAALASHALQRAGRIIRPGHRPACRLRHQLLHHARRQPQGSAVHTAQVLLGQELRPETGLRLSPEFLVAAGRATGALPAAIGQFS